MKKAIIFGFDYKGTQNELPDCELDANRIADAATSAGFLVQKMYQSTVVNFRAIVESLKTSPADETIIYYSGHGTQYPVVNDASEPDGREEALCFWNGHGIELCTDNAFKSLVESIPGKVTVILDSCFSGGMDRLALPPGFIRRAIEVIPPSEFRTLSKAEKAANNETVYLFAAQENQFSNSTGDGGAFTTARRFVQPYTTLSITGSTTLTAGHSFIYLTDGGLTTGTYNLTLPTTAEMLDGEILRIICNFAPASGINLQFVLASGQTFNGAAPGSIGFVTGGGGQVNKNYELQFIGGDWRQLKSN